MEVVLMLEEKIKALIAMAKGMKEEHVALQSKYNSLNDEYSSLKNENTELKAENDKLAEGNAQLTFQLNTIEKSILKETGHVQELTEERSMTRLVLDDLIKSIDSIVENENQP
jgi:FtsZ-binding cell division protein ZapB